MKQQQLRQTHFNAPQGQANVLQHQDEAHHQTAMALQALAAATSDDRSAVANLTLANKQLTEHLDTMSTKVTNLEARLIKMDEKIDKLIEKNYRTVQQ